MHQDYYTSYKTSSAWAAYLIDVLHHSGMLFYTRYANNHEEGSSAVVQYSKAES